MTNGTLTKKIMKLAHDKRVDVKRLEREAEVLMDKFPLSSMKLVYDDELKELPEDRQLAVLKAAVKSDKRKRENAIRLFTNLGGTRERAEASVGEFGRALLEIT